jgi:pyridinium-3,5-bisthiocarboxylic acid mononucleotide nickel chelatase
METDSKRRALVFDPFAGISGDMILGALVDLGLEDAWLQDYVAALGLGRIQVVVERAMRRGISCGRVRFELPHEHAHRHLPDVLRIIEGSGASAEVKERASEAFRRLAAAEGAVHGVPVERVHFHEVGALDAILDVLCAMAGVEALGFDAFYTRPVAVGTGYVDIAHGRFPLPAPATAKLLEGLVVKETGFAGECTTPTGAAILATLTAGKQAPAQMVVLRSGYGAGSRDPENRPNCLRLFAVEEEAVRGGTLYAVETDLDDLSPEYLPPAQEALVAAGALDVTVAATSMKKGRPGLRLSLVVPESALDGVLTALFRTTTTIGARYWPVERTVLARSEEVVEWHGQQVRCKRVRLPGGGERLKPEFEDVVLAARALGMAPFEVWTKFAVDGPARQDARR